MPVWWALLQMHKQPLVWSAQQQQLSGSSCPPEPDLLSPLVGAKLTVVTGTGLPVFPWLSLGRFPAIRVAFLHHSASRHQATPLYI